MQFVTSGKVCVHKVQKIACDVCLNVFAKWRIEQNDIALPIPTGSTCGMYSSLCAKLLCPSLV